MMLSRYSLSSRRGRSYSSGGQMQQDERRATERFPMEREVKYKVTGRNGAGHAGEGATVNMSSGGVLFTTSDAISPGRKVEVSIAWPAQLNERCALRFVAQGRVVRSDG